MEKLAVKIFTVLFVISFIIAIPIAIVKGHVENTTLNATYMNKTDHGTKMKFTKDISEVINSHVVFLYVDGREYRGYYRFEMGKKFEKYVSVYFNGYPDSNEEGYSYSLNMRLKYSKKKITVVSSYGEGVDDEGSPLALNQIFIKRTWWNTWGLKLCIVLIVAFIVWLLRIPEFIMNKKYREESINEFRESKKEYDKEQAEGKMYYDKEVSEYRETMNEGINELKNTMKEVKEGVTEMKNIFKKGLEEYKKDNKKGQE